MRIGVIVDNDFFQDIRVRKEVELLRDCGYSIVVLCFCFNKDKKEHNIMLERKIYRIYDSGNLKLIYNKK